MPCSDPHTCLSSKLPTGLGPVASRDYPAGEMFAEVCRGSVSLGAVHQQKAEAGHWEAEAATGPGVNAEVETGNPAQVKAKGMLPLTQD